MADVFMIFFLKNKFSKMNNILLKNYIVLSTLALHDILTSISLRKEDVVYLQAGRIFVKVNLTFSLFDDMILIMWSLYVSWVLVAMFSMMFSKSPENIWLSILNPMFMTMLACIIFKISGSEMVYVDMQLPGSPVSCTRMYMMNSMKIYITNSFKLSMIFWSLMSSKFFKLGQKLFWFTSFLLTLLTHCLTTFFFEFLPNLCYSMLMTLMEYPDFTAYVFMMTCLLISNKKFCSLFNKLKTDLLDNIYVWWEFLKINLKKTSNPFKNKRLKKMFSSPIFLMIMDILELCVALYLVYYWKWLGAPGYGLNKLMVIIYIVMMYTYFSNK